MALGKRSSEIEIGEITQAYADVWILSDAPFYANRMAEKAKRELLLPRRARTRADLAAKLKHAPVSEFRSSPYLRRRPNGGGGIGFGPHPAAAPPPPAPADAPETYMMIRANSLKRAMETAALRMPSSVAKAQIACLVSIVGGDYAPLWGIPRLDMSVVRLAGISRVPDIRTRARLEQWAVRARLSWLEPLLNLKKVEQLLQIAGMMCGLGDWRQEKGGSNGRFHVVEPDDERLLELLETAGWSQQQEAFAIPECSNDETAELYTWYCEELNRRGLKVEDEEPEEIEVKFDEVDQHHFNAAGDDLLAPDDKTDRLARQDSEEVA
jgi:hypothetical protein